MPKHDEEFWNMKLVCLSFLPHYRGKIRKMGERLGKKRHASDEEYLPNCDEEFWNSMKKSAQTSFRTTGIKLERRGKETEEVHLMRSVCQIRMRS